ncbi:galanin receptor type 1 isoform X2 [Lepisosteus oculatus]|uniref:galanin receptor type 1 isoform X2 n=1 Tax=Lepisosteus oculatus TaxID=7918 RepID=UPI0035F501BA
MDAAVFHNQSERASFFNRTDAREAPTKLLFGIGIDNFITLLIFGLIFTLGVLGNSMVITVLARSKPGKPRSTTNIFILNLSIADLSYLLFCIPFQSTVYMLPTWVLGAFICKFIHYFFTVSMLVSIFTLSAMSVDRYIAIVHSRKSSSIRVARHALIGVIAIWILSLAMAAPVAHHQNIVERGGNSTFCWEVWPDHKQKKIYVVCTFVFGYLLPLLLISFCYAKVLNHLHKKLRNMSKKSEASKKKTAQTVLVVVIVFCISWLPHHVVYLWVEFGSFPLNQASFVFRVAAHCLAYSNSSVNPIIYAFLSENFRKAYKQVFKCQITGESPLNDVKEIRSKVDTPPSTNCTNVIHIGKKKFFSCYCSKGYPCVKS